MIGGAISSDASRKASNTQSDAADKAAQLQKDAYDETVKRNAPFVAGGLSSFNSLLDRLGLSGNTEAPGYNTFGKAPTAQEVMAEPGYQFGLTEGQKALDRQAAARGMAYSGAQLKAASRFGNDYATGQYGNAFARNRQVQNDTYNQLVGLSNMGQTSANNTATAGNQYATQAGGALWAGAGANAANSLAQGNIWGNVLNQGVSAYNNRDRTTMPTTPDYNGLGGGWGNYNYGGGF